MKARVFSMLLRLLSASWRYRITGEAPRSPAVLAFWHGSMLAVWKHFAHGNAIGITSMSKDGDLLAGLLHDWGFTVIRGSSSRGGAEVLDAMVEHARRSVVLITPDGPRGPAHIAKPGAVIAAQRAQVPLVFCSVSIARCIVFSKSWDRFQVPLPWSTIHLHFHPQRTFAEEATREEMQGAIDDLQTLA